MSRLPTPGQDAGNWGDILNDYLRVEINADGTLKKAGDITQAKADAAQALLTAQQAASGTIADGSVTNAKLDSATQTILSSVNDKYSKPGSGIPASDLSSVVQTSLDRADTALQTVTKADIGLSNADNTNDSNKPVSTLVQAALNLKAPLVNPTFSGVVTVPTPTNATDATTKAYVDSQVSNGTADATTTAKGKIQLAGDLGGTAAVPTVPGLTSKANTADVYTKSQIDASLASKANAADLATVATTGNYNDLINKPVTTTSSGTVPALENAPTTGFGHSFLASASSLSPGPGADVGGHALERVAIRCHTQTMTNFAAGGTRSDQILSSVIANHAPNTRGVVMFGGGHRNDQNFYGNGSPNTNTVKEAIRSIFAHLVARNIYTYSDTCFAFGAGWTSGTSSTPGSYVDFAFSGDGAFITFTTATSTGGTFIIQDGGGTTLKTIATGNYGASFRGVTKISGQGAGTHSFRLTVQSGSVTIPALIIPAATPPLIVWQLETPYNPAIVSGSTLANTVSAQYLAASQTILSDFDTSRVVVVDTPPTWNAVVDTCPDGVHPSAQGHSKIADWAITKIIAANIDFMQGLNWMTGTLADPTTYTSPTPSYSSSDTVTPTVPGTPVATGSTGSIGLSWAASTDAVGVSGYRVYRSDAPTSVLGSSASTSYTDSSAVAGSPYTYTVSAYDGAGNESAKSASSNSASATTGGTVYSADTFTRTNSASLGNTETGGYAWTANPSSDQSGWTINTNRMVKTSGVNLIAPKELLIDDAHADGIIQATLVSAINTGSGIVVRVSGDGTTGLLIDRAAADSKYRVRTRSGSTYTTIFTSTATGAAGDVVRITLAGPSIDITVNGTSFGSATTSVNQTATRHGFYAPTSNTTSFDDWTHTS